MSASAIFGNAVFLRGFDLKIEMGVTLLFCNEFKQMTLFREQPEEIYIPRQQVFTNYVSNCDLQERVILRGIFDLQI